MENIKKKIISSDKAASLLGCTKQWFNKKYRDKLNLIETGTVKKYWDYNEVIALQPNIVSIRTNPNFEIIE